MVSCAILWDLSFFGIFKSSTAGVCLCLNGGGAWEVRGRGQQNYEFM